MPGSAMIQRLKDFWLGLPAWLQFAAILVTLPLWVVLFPVAFLVVMFAFIVGDIRDAVTGWAGPSRESRK